MKKHRKDIENVSEDALSFFEVVSSAARAELIDRRPTTASALASPNSFTSPEAGNSLRAIDESQRRSFEVLAKEPAIARVVAKKADGTSITYYFSRVAPIALPGDGRKFSGRNSPAGRLAALDVGDEHELKTPSGIVLLQISEKALLYPKLEGSEWDSTNSVLNGEKYGYVTLLSMREFVSRESKSDGAAILQEILADDAASGLIFEGIKRSVLTKIGLRDRPILDRYQDEIFRLPLNSQLLIIGPPGSGKTTTLIRRLGQKLDNNYLDEDERRLANNRRFADLPAHRDSWLMFTPTDLLRVYLKEAFNREAIAAPDEKISTWSRFQWNLARNQFRILKTSTRNGPFVLRDGVAALRDSAIHRPTDWYDDFRGWHWNEFWSGLVEAADRLANSQESDLSRMGRSLASSLSDWSTSSFSSSISALSQLTDGVEKLLAEKKLETDSAIKKSLTLQLNMDRGFLEQFSAHLEKMGNSDEEGEELDDEDEDYAQAPRTQIAAAARAYAANLRGQARARADKRTLGKGRTAKIAEWIGARTMEQQDLVQVGEKLKVQADLRKCVRPLRRYLASVPANYRKFRRSRRAEGKWYTAEVGGQSDVNSLEVDVMLLCIMQAASDLIQNPSIQRQIDQPAYEDLQNFANLLRNQIVVDEATDFSPIQLACMGTISNPSTQSFFACGDFNQRITEWGSRTDEDIKWAFPNIQLKPINVTYRHSKQLNKLAKDIVKLCSGDIIDVALPKDTDNEGVQPVLGKSLQSYSQIVEWLSSRIIEIEGITSPLPSVAVLVNDEADVRPIAEALKAALINENINVVPCYGGQFAGVDNDVRVFDVQHIKGLEFEAVFFVGIDDLGSTKPDIFDKFLYVGATRAATYLGLTCSGPGLPPKIVDLEKDFSEKWEL